MWSRLVVVLLLLSSVVGCGRGSGSSSSGAIVGVEPTALVRGRTMTITVIGDGTNWSGIDESDVEIRTRDGEVDSSIEVVSVNVANDQYLEIALTIAVDSFRDIRHLRVGEDRLDGVLHVESPFNVVEATSIAPGHFFRLALQGQGTDWIPGAVTLEGSVPEVLFEGVRVSPGLFPPFDDVVTPLGVEVLRNDFLYVTGYVEFFAPPGPVDITIHAAGDDDQSAAAIEVAPLEITNLVVGVPLAEALETPFETHVYRANLPINSTCEIDYYFDPAAGQQIALEVFNPSDPLNRYYGGATPTTYWSYGYYGSSIVWNPTELIVIVHDLQFGGGEEFTYGLDYTCVTVDPDPLTAGVAVAGEMMAGADQVRTYELPVSPWMYSDVTIVPTGVGPMDPYSVIYMEGAQDRSPDDYGYATVRMFSGLRTRALYTVEDTDDFTGPASEYTITWTETPVAGTLFASAVPAQSIPDATIIGDLQSYADSTLAVPAGTLPGAIHVAIDVQHRFESDLYIDLISPLGVQVRLYEGYPYYYNDAGVLQVFGNGLADYPPETIPTSGGYDALAAVELLNPVGTWTLRVYDTYPADSGILNGWALSIE